MKTLTESECGLVAGGLRKAGMRRARRRASALGRRHSAKSGKVGTDLLKGPPHSGGGFSGGGGSSGGGSSGFGSSGGGSSGFGSSGGGSSGFGSSGGGSGSSNDGGGYSNGNGSSGFTSTNGTNNPGDIMHKDADGQYVLNTYATEADGRDAMGDMLDDAKYGNIEIGEMGQTYTPNDNPGTWDTNVDNYMAEHGYANAGSTTPNEMSSTEYNVFLNAVTNAEGNTNMGSLGH